VCHFWPIWPISQLISATIAEEANKNLTRNRLQCRPGRGGGHSPAELHFGIRLVDLEPFCALKPPGQNLVYRARQLDLRVTDMVIAASLPMHPAVSVAPHHARDVRGFVERGAALFTPGHSFRRWCRLDAKGLLLQHLWIIAVRAFERIAEAHAPDTEDRAGALQLAQVDVGPAVLTRDDEIEVTAHRVGQVAPRHGRLDQLGQSGVFR
jgi:hypothetical protein